MQRKQQVSSTQVKNTSANTSEAPFTYPYVYLPASLHHIHLFLLFGTCHGSLGLTCGQEMLEGWTNR